MQETDRESLNAWTSRWDDLVDFEITQVAFFGGVLGRAGCGGASSLDIGARKSPARGRAVISYRTFE